MNSVRHKLTDTLVGYTTVNNLQFIYDSNNSTYDLVVDLEKPNERDRVRVKLKQVSNLLLREFGGGLTQLLCLVVNDLRENQLDRIRYHVKDVERSMFECMCNDIDIINLIVN